MDILDAILGRRSMRSFTPEDVSEEQIQTLLRCGMASPSGHNRQAWSFVVLPRLENVDEVFGPDNFNNKIYAAAAAIIVVCAHTTFLNTPEQGEPSVEDNPTWRDDVASCTTNILTAAKALGLGAVWTASYPYPDRMNPLRSYLGLPDDVLPYSVIPIGYPAFDAKPKDKFKPEKIHYGKWFLSCALFLAGLSCLAQPRIDNCISLTLNHPDGQYELGDTVRLTANLLKDYPAALEYTIFENGHQIKTVPLGKIEGSSVVWEDVRTKPTAVMLEFRPFGTTPRVLERNVPASDDAFKIGYIAGAEGFKPGFKAPKDLHRWWKKQIRELRKVPMKVEMRPFPLNHKDSASFQCWEVTINSIDDTPVRGYLVKPKSAKAHSHPISLHMHAAGVVGSWCRCKPEDALYYSKISNAIALDFNAHGMLNGQSEEYYRDLEKGQLANYSGRLMTDRESWYFRTMILRAVRALDFMAEDPLWDGKTVIVTGESQGGAQSVALAGLDSRVTDVVVNVPAMIGNAGSLVGRINAWPYPLEHNGAVPGHKGNEGVTPAHTKAVLKYAPYFDGAVLLKGCKANFLVEVGMIDTTCPPAEVFSGLNGIKGRVQVISSPYRPHHARMAAQYRPWWLQNVEKVRTDYLASFAR